MTTGKRIELISAIDSQKFAVISDRHQVSYGQLKKLALEFSEELQQRGCRRVGVYLTNGLEWIVTDFAVSQANLTLIPLPLFFSPDQLQHVIQDCNLDTIISTTDLCFSLLQGEWPQSEVYEPLSLLIYQRAPAMVDELYADTALITYTSGSTGKPKGVCLTERALMQVSASLVTALEELQIKRHLCLLPLSTLLENLAGVLAPLSIGAEVIVPGLDEIGFGQSSQLDPQRFLACIERYQPESIILLPEMLKMLVGFVVSGVSLPASLKFVAVGGAVVSRQLIERACGLGIPVYEGYGLSECASVVSLNRPSACKIGTSGKPLDHAQVKISDDGEILVSGSTLNGYLHAEQYAEQDYFPTGDLGYLDDDGYLVIRGRKKNVFLTSYGRQISPEWIENALADHAHIQQAAVYGENLAFNLAVIVPSHSDLAISDIGCAVQSVNAKLPDYARIERFILAEAPFTTENGCLTAGRQLNRSLIWNKYLPIFFDYKTESAQSNLSAWG